MVNDMKQREVTVSIRMTGVEQLRAHALADAGDESIGRWLRRLVNIEYERRFGQAAPPPKKTRMGRPRGSVSR